MISSVYKLDIEFESIDSALKDYIVFGKRLLNNKVKSLHLHIIYALYTQLHIYAVQLLYTFYMNITYHYIHECICAYFVFTITFPYINNGALCSLREKGEK